MNIQCEVPEQSSSIDEVTTMVNWVGIAPNEDDFRDPLAVIVCESGRVGTIRLSQLLVTEFDSPVKKTVHRLKGDPVRDTDDRALALARIFRDAEEALTEAEAHADDDIPALRLAATRAGATFAAAEGAADAAVTRAGLEY